MMQLMQVCYSTGGIAEIVFFAYVLKVAPTLEMSQNLTAYVQTSYLVAHTAAGLLGDALLNNTSMTTKGLMYISASSVCIAFISACTFRPVDPDRPINLRRPFAFMVKVYSTKKFWIVTLWWVMMYSSYNLIY